MKVLLLPLVLLLSAGASQAAVVYSGIQNIAIATTFDGVYLDIDTGTTGTSPVTGWDINAFFGGYGIGNSAEFQPVRSGTGNDDAIWNMAEGQLISSTSLFSSGEGGSSTHTGTDAGQFGLGMSGFIGFRFMKNDNSGPLYGWMRITPTANTPGGMIQDWAYDDTGDGILAGSLVALPEPGRATLLMLGLAVGVLRRRRRTVINEAAQGL